MPVFADLAEQAFLFDLISFEHLFLSEQKIVNTCLPVSVDFIN